MREKAFFSLFSSESWNLHCFDSWALEDLYQRLNWRSVIVLQHFHERYSLYTDLISLTVTPTEWKRVAVSRYSRSRYSQIAIKSWIFFFNDKIRIRPIGVVFFTWKDTDSLYLTYHYLDIKLRKSVHGIHKFIYLLNNGLLSLRQFIFKLIFGRFNMP